MINIDFIISSIFKANMKNTNICSILFVLGVLIISSCSTIKPLHQEEEIKLEISDFKLLHKGNVLAVYQLKAKLMNHTKETIQIILPLAETSADPYDWHKPEFFNIHSEPDIGPMFIDQVPGGELIVKTSKEVVTISAGKSLDFVFNSNCTTGNNMRMNFEGDSNLILNYEVNPEKKEYWLKKLPKDANIRITVDQLPEISIKSNILKISI